MSLLALVVGLSAGLTYAWVVAPLRTVDTAPSTLRGDFKDQFRTLIAASYAATHNLERARARLALLGDANPVDALTAQAQRMLASGQPFQVVRDVAGLASDLRAGQVSAAPEPTATLVLAAAPSLAAPTSFPVAPTQVDLVEEATATATGPAPNAAVTMTAGLVTSTAGATKTLIPTASPTASAPFELVSQDQVCNANLTQGLMQVSALDRRRHQIPGVKVSISWTGGEETFFTGLKPEIGDGYADYVMKAGVIYSLDVGQAGGTIPNLTAPSCPGSGGQSYLGGLKLVFQQP